MRPFSKWASEQLEITCARNDKPRPGKKPKGPWEVVDPGDLYQKIMDESLEMIWAWRDWTETPCPKNREALQWELADVATTAMMLSARIDPEMSKFRRGK